MSLVTCDRVGNDLTNWADNATPEEKEALCEALDCSDDSGLAEVAVQDTPSVDLSGNGTDASPLKADVKLSAKADNCLTIEGDGLHVPCPEASGLDEVAAQDTPSVDLSGDGTDANPIKADVKLSAKADNCLTIEDDGLHVACSGEGGMAEVVTEDTSTVRMTGDGSTADPLKSDVKISTETGNQLSIRGDGLFVPAGNGPEGPAGPQGPAGPAGADGAEGPQGPQGPAGPAGEDGAEGPQGPQGPAGPSGADGAEGPAGADGKDGAEGPMGPQGPQGPQGLQGPQGPMGPMGPQGPAGGGGGGDVEISPDENNCLEKRGNGLYVPCPKESCGTPEDFIFDVINDDGLGSQSPIFIASTAPMAQFRLAGVSFMSTGDIEADNSPAYSIASDTFEQYGYPARYPYPLLTEDELGSSYRSGRYYMTPQKGATVAIVQLYH